MQLKYCAVSGLPIGYLPNCRIRNKMSIPYSAFSLEETRQIVLHAQKENALLEDRKFAFCTLFYKIPSQLLILKAEIKPNWESQKIQNCLHPQALENFSACVSSLLSLSEKQLLLFPSYNITSEYYTNNTSLEDFPFQLARWIALLTSTEQEKSTIRLEHNFAQQAQDAKKAKNLFSASGGRKQQNEKLHIFDTRVSSPAQLASLTNQLAAFYDRKPNLSFQNLIRNPWIFPSARLHEELIQVRTLNASAFEDGINYLFELSSKFAAWLDAAYVKAKAQENVNREVQKIFVSQDLITLQSVGTDASHINELLERSTDRQKEEYANGKPNPVHYKSVALYIEALKAFMQNKGK